MTQLDRHIGTVQRRVGLIRFNEALAWALTGAAGIVVITILVDRVLGYHLPYARVAVLALAVAAFVGAMVWGMVHRPSEMHSAILIDSTLELKEKFSTALVLRGEKDEFAKAAVKDAEWTADHVSLSRRFPIPWPRAAWGTLVAIVVAGLLFLFLPSMDLFGHQEAVKKHEIEVANKVEAKKVVEKALAVLYQAPKGVAENEDVKLARRDLENLASNPIKDPAQARRSALKAMQDMDAAIKQQVKQNKNFATAQNEAKMFRGLNAPIDEKGPVADSERALAKGDFSEAVNELQKVADNFNKMSDQEKKQAAQQMQQMAQRLQQMANNQQLQQQMQQQLQKMGANQQQAQQMAKMMQQAAQGNKQAQQQVQKMAQQAMQQMSPQQKQAAQQAMQQAQAQANAQQQAQQMSQAAQQMAQAMQQASQQQGQQGQKQQGQQQGRNQQMAQNQQGQQAMQQMQQAMQQMQAMQADAKQVAAAQKAAQQAAADAASGLAGNQGQNGQNQNGGPQQQGKGQWANAQQPGGNQNGQFNGQPGGQMFNNGGQGMGDRSQKSVAPFGVKEEIAPTQDIENGKILASTFVKAGTIKGESKEQLKAITASIEKEATEEVDTERISRSSQEVVKKYFSTIEGEGK